MQRVKYPGFHQDKPYPIMTAKGRAVNELSLLKNVGKLVFGADIATYAQKVVTEDVRPKAKRVAVSSSSKTSHQQKRKKLVPSKKGSSAAQPSGLKGEYISTSDGGQGGADVEGVTHLPTLTRGFSFGDADPQLTTPRRRKKKASLVTSTRSTEEVVSGIISIEGCTNTTSSAFDAGAKGKQEEEETSSSGMRRSLELKAFQLLNELTTQQFFLDAFWWLFLEFGAANEEVDSLFEIHKTTAAQPHGLHPALAANFQTPQESALRNNAKGEQLVTRRRNSTRMNPVAQRGGKEKRGSIFEGAGNMYGGVQTARTGSNNRTLSPTTSQPSIQSSRSLGSSRHAVEFEHKHVQLPRLPRHLKSQKEFGTGVRNAGDVVVAGASTITNPEEALPLLPKLSLPGLGGGQTPRGATFSAATPESARSTSSAASDNSLISTLSDAMSHCAVPRSVMVDFAVLDPVAVPQVICKEQQKLFTRLATNYAAILHALTLGHATGLERDRITEALCDVLGQALFAGFFKAFPYAREYFATPEFLENIFTVLTFWMFGVERRYVNSLSSDDNGRGLTESRARVLKKLLGNEEKEKLKQGNRMMEDSFEAVLASKRILGGQHGSKPQSHKTDAESPSSKWGSVGRKLSAVAAIGKGGESEQSHGGSILRRKGTAGAGGGKSFRGRGVSLLHHPQPQVHDEFDIEQAQLRDALTNIRKQALHNPGATLSKKDNEEEGENNFSLKTHTTQTSPLISSSKSSMKLSKKSSHTLRTGPKEESKQQQQQPETDNIEDLVQKVNSGVASAAILPKLQRGARVDHFVHGEGDKQISTYVVVEAAKPPPTPPTLKRRSLLLTSPKSTTGNSHSIPEQKGATVAGGLTENHLNRLDHQDKAIASKTLIHQYVSSTATGGGGGGGGDNPLSHDGGPLSPSSTRQSFLGKNPELGVSALSNQGSSNFYELQPGDSELYDISVGGEQLASPRSHDAEAPHTNGEQQNQHQQEHSLLPITSVPTKLVYIDGKPFSPKNFLVNSGTGSPYAQAPYVPEVKVQEYIHSTIGKPDADPMEAVRRRELKEAEAKAAPKKAIAKILKPTTHVKGIVKRLGDVNEFDQKAWFLAGKASRVLSDRQFDVVQHGKFGFNDWSPLVHRYKLLLGVDNTNASRGMSWTVLK